jgi:hypothetical protein
MFVFKSDDILDNLWLVDHILKKKPLTNMKKSGIKESCLFKNCLELIFFEISNYNAHFILSKIRFFSLIRRDKLCLE